MMVDLRPDHLEIVKRILAGRVPEYQVRAFGSRVCWTAKDTSDLDLVVMTDAPLGLARLADLQEAFSESDLPFRVDVLDWAATGVEFREIIEQDYAVIQQPISTGSSGLIWRGLGMEGKAITGPVPDGWKVTTLGEIVKQGGGHIQTGPFGSQLHASDYVPVGVPSIMPVNIGDNRIIEKGIARITETDAERLSRHRVQADDIVYSRRGDVERRALIHPEQEGWLCGTGCLKVRLGNGGIDPGFVSYYLGHPEVRAWILRHAVGATMPNLNTSIMKAIPLLVPPLEEQQAVACILGTLDDKIDLNRRMNETLEGIARAIFKSWFVDFVPVRARAQRKDAEAQRRKEKQGQDSFASLRLGGSALNPAIADLFPDAFEESELGEIPREWEIWRVADVGEVVCGKTPSTKIPEYYGNDVPFIRIPDMHGKIFATKTQKMLSLAGAASQEKTTLPAGSICVSCIGTVGLVIITTQESQTNQQINSVIPKSPNETYFWYWVFLDLRDKIKARGSGGSVLTNLSKGRFSQLKIQSPPASLRSSYNTLVGPLFERILLNDKESGILAALRDTLLPKLISGELRVPDAERIVGRCV